MLTGVSSAERRAGQSGTAAVRDMPFILLPYTMSYQDGAGVNTGAGAGSSSAIVPTSGGANNGGRKQKQPRQILKEEDYQQTLSQIVERDYYPALPSLHRDLAVLERRGAGDVSGAVAVRRAYRRVAEEEEKAAEAERLEDEQARTQSGGTRKRPRPLERESLTGFHDRATSEDNEEFDRVTRREEDERIIRMRALYNAGLGKGGLLQLKGGTAHHAASGVTSGASRSNVLGAETPLLPASDQFDAPVERVVDAMARPADTNSLFFVPEHHSRHGIREDDNNNNDGERKADNLPLLEGERGNSSSLMLPPPPRNTRKGNGKGPNVLAKRDSSSTAVGKGNPKMDLVEYIAKPRSDANDIGIRAVPTINAAMTRFPHQGESRLPPASGRRNTKVGNIAMASSNHSVASSDTDATTDLDATPMSLAGERAARADALARERESYVAMTPIILPGGDRGRGNESPITTWGTVAGTPLVLSGSGQANNTNAARPTAGPIDNDDIDGSDQNQMKSFALPAEDSIEATARIAEARLSSRTKAYRDAQSSVKRRPATNDSGSKPTRKGVGSSKVRASTSTSSMHSRAESLTPAAQALLARGTPKSSLSSMSTMSGKVSARSSSALGSALRSSYTPMSSSRSLISKRRNTASATPRMRRDESSSSSRKNSIATAVGDKSRTEKKAGGITDGLLKI